MKTIVRFYLVLLCMILVCPLQAQKNDVKRKNVLVVSSYSSDSERTARFLDKFEQLIDEHSYPYVPVVSYMGYL